MNEYQRKLLYSIIVAGKTAQFANNKLNDWITNYVQEDELPFEAIRRLIKNDQLEDSFRDVGTGNYTKLTRACREIISSGINIKTCDPDDLKDIYGIGPKTSRFFVVWTRPDEEYAVLDTHILKWMDEQGYDVPDSTPQSLNRYKKLEEQFISEAKSQGKNPRELDFEVWSDRSTDLNIV